MGSIRFSIRFMKGHYYFPNFPQFYRHWGLQLPHFLIRKLILCFGRHNPLVTYHSGRCKSHVRSFRQLIESLTPGYGRRSVWEVHTIKRRRMKIENSKTIFSWKITFQFPSEKPEFTHSSVITFTHSFIPLHAVCNTESLSMKMNQVRKLAPFSFLVGWARWLVLCGSGFDGHSLNFLCFI